MDKKIAYSVLNIKSFEDTGEERLIEGIASTPTVDRMGDEVNPLGAIFQTPMPLLLHHNHEMPVGNVEFAEATPEGIPFKARIAKIDEPGVLKDRVDEAWQSVKAGLIRAVSIGFSAIKWSETKTGLMFDEWEWYELSLVTIPANAEATITNIKKFDIDHKKSFNSDIEVKDLQTAGDSACTKEEETKTQTTPQTKTYKETKMNRFEQIAKLKKSLNEQKQALADLPLEADTADFESIKGVIEGLKSQIERLEYAQANALEEVTPADEIKGKTETQAKASASNSPSDNATKKSKNFVEIELKEEKGMQFARAARCIALAKSNPKMAVEIAKNRYSDNQQVIDTVALMTKSAVAPATNTDLPYAGYLVDPTVVDFYAYQEPLSIIGQLTNKREIPFGQSWVEDTGVGQATWTGEGKRKSATEFALRLDVMNGFKLAAVAVATMENIQDSGGKTDKWIRDSLARVLNRELDYAFINPANAGTANVKPASITNGVTAIPSTGTAYGDLKAGILSYVTQTKKRTGKVLVDGYTYTSLLLEINDITGVPSFPELALRNQIRGFDIVVSDNLAAFADSSGRIMVFVDEESLVFGYSPAAPDLIVKASDQASVVLETDPEAEAEMISLWQNNMVGFLVERRISWKKARTNSGVVVINGIEW